jgi:RNA:NAD 2'-phosphotransferase (TPT1/KptA family)
MKKSELIQTIKEVILTEHNSTVLYHVTSSDNIPNIKKKGIVSQKQSTFTGAFGQDIRQKKNAIYAFEKIEDAISLCFKLT